MFLYRYQYLSNLQSAGLVSILNNWLHIFGLLCVSQEISQEI